MKNLFVECRNLRDKTVHISDNDSIDVVVCSRVGEDSVRTAELAVSFTNDGVCKVTLYDADRIVLGQTEMDVATRESAEVDD